MNTIEIITCHLRDRFPELDITVLWPIHINDKKTTIEARIRLGQICSESLWFHSSSDTIIIIESPFNSCEIDLACPDSLDEFDVIVEQYVKYRQASWQSLGWSPVARGGLF